MLGMGMGATFYVGKWGRPVFMALERKEGLLYRTELCVARLRTSLMSLHPSTQGFSQALKRLTNELNRKLIYHQLHQEKELRAIIIFREFFSLSCVATLV